MSAPPQLPPPPTDGDVNRGKELNGVIWLLTGITTVVYLSRVYARKYLTRNLGWEDVILGVSMTLLYIQSAFVSVSIHYGLARHQYYLLISNPLNISKVVKWQLFSEPVAILGTTIPKVAVTMLLIKLLDPNKLAVAWLWALNILLNALSIVCIITSFVQCTPTSAYWTRAGGKCWDPSIVANLAISQGALSAFTDFSLALFPTTVVLNLQMNWRKKAAVCSLMGFGCFAGVAAIIRTTKLAKLAEQTDFTWSIWTLVLWVAIECCVIIVCACVPSLRPLFRKLYNQPFGSTFPSLFSRRKGGSDNSYMLNASPQGSMQSGKEGRVVKITANEDGSQVCLARGIRTTTDVEVQHSAWK
ncbi:hypothetical protein BU26DRAFT_607669 [Trematosphaeria pertusa]|uniref:Rhodopsin domain-containing protein n=1 Tax=Trematosphaeria pertusa TaxID=390896 RepID=A0A6A6I5U4_9PLEO|nr:uncharacterized protein BU26DRAFT_607669 [Trematosphaeria pertusa]KAF2245418.1 hypothetical protein BU26DRAFT_607669 [Trematosphaeria pertusa]